MEGVFCEEGRRCKKPCMLNDMADSAFVQQGDSGSSSKEAQAAQEQQQGTASPPHLLLLPSECLEKILCLCDAQTLMAVAQTSTAFRAFDAASGLRLVDKIAKQQVLDVAGDAAGRWR